ncbi:hypothetical protein [Micromonospora sp. SH-82]|uniref:hypothetical protein n=1 Tax=Micromonospora sp. SH-82 TaxID=3132938 RepID=UPI003EBC3182
MLEDNVEGNLRDPENRARLKREVEQGSEFATALTNAMQNGHQPTADEHAAYDKWQTQWVKLESAEAALRVESSLVLGTPSAVRQTGVTYNAGDRMAHAWPQEWNRHNWTPEAYAHHAQQTRHLMPYDPLLDRTPGVRQAHVSQAAQQPLPGTQQMNTADNRVDPSGPSRYQPGPSAERPNKRQRQ